MIFPCTKTDEEAIQLAHEILRKYYGDNHNVIIEKAAKWWAYHGKHSPNGCVYPGHQACFQFL